MTAKMTILYQSTIRGKASDKGDMVYFGKIYRVPRAAYGKMEQAVLDGLETDPEDLLIDIGDAEPVQGAIIERYEVFDQDTEDILVMWRIPYRKKA